MAIFGDDSHSKTSRSQAEAALHGEIRETLKAEFPDAHPLAPAMCSEKVLRKGCVHEWLRACMCAPWSH